MPQRPIKLSRRDFHQPPEFLSFGDRTRDFIKAYARSIGLAGAGILVVMGAVFGVRQYEIRQDRLTAEKFYEAFVALQGQQYARAEAGFRELAERQPGRRLGRLAKFYLASCYLEQGQLDKARVALTDALASLDDSLFKGMALMDLGSVYEQTGNLERAEAAYREAMSLSSSTDKLSAELALARIKAEHGDKAGAIADYQRFLTEHPYAAQRQEALEALANLGASASSPATVSSAKNAAAR
jgi:tetratricopeptide (TPR) repeat protein